MSKRIIQIVRIIVIIYAIFILIGNTINILGIIPASELATEPSLKEKFINTLDFNLLAILILIPYRKINKRFFSNCLIGLQIIFTFVAVSTRLPDINLVLEGKIHKSIILVVSLNILIFLSNIVACYYISNIEKSKTLEWKGNKRIDKKFKNKKLLLWKKSIYQGQPFTIIMTANEVNPIIYIAEWWDFSNLY